MEKLSVIHIYTLNNIQSVIGLFTIWSALLAQHCIHGRRDQEKPLMLQSSLKLLWVWSCAFCLCGLTVIFFCCCRKSITALFSCDWICDCHCGSTIVFWCGSEQRNTRLSSVTIECDSPLPELVLGFLVLLISSWSFKLLTTLQCREHKVNEICSSCS